MLDPLPFSKFEEFHNSFNCDTEKSFKVCSQCKGKCEYDSIIAPLLPGEAEFIAAKIKLPVDVTRNKFFDGVLIEDNVVDIIKSDQACRFLSDSFLCLAKPFKPVVCAIYPVYLRPDGGVISFITDKKCKLSIDPKIKELCESIGIQSVQKLSIPIQWLQITDIISMSDFNFNKMMAKRDIPVDKYKLYQLDELMAYAY